MSVRRPVEVATAFDETDVGAVQLPLEDLPDDAMMFLLPSRFCLSDLLHDEAWELFGAIDPGWRGRRRCPTGSTTTSLPAGVSSPITTAADVLENRTGVCRDFAHLGVTFCRALNIPARYVFGYLPDIGVPPADVPMDFCAWLEVYLGDRWWTFDPRNNVRRTGRVVIGRGRDALDVAMVTTYGGAVLETMPVWADKREEPAGHASDAAVRLPGADPHPRPPPDGDAAGPRRGSGADRSGARGERRGAVVTETVDAFGNLAVRGARRRCAGVGGVRGSGQVERHDGDVACPPAPTSVGCSRLRADLARRGAAKGGPAAEPVGRRRHGLAHGSTPGSPPTCTTATTSPTSTRRQPRPWAWPGVCQDYAHVMLALCRLSGLPARYVSGHMLGEGGSHAWVEVVIPAGDGSGRGSGRPLRSHPRPRGRRLYLTVAVGRDYADVAPPTAAHPCGPAGGVLSTTKSLEQEAADLGACSAGADPTAERAADVQPD